MRFLSFKTTVGILAGKKLIYSHLPDLQRWQMRKKVISHKEAHKDPVINTSFKIKSERQTGHSEFSFQILQHTHKRKRTLENTVYGV